MIALAFDRGTIVLRRDGPHEGAPPGHDPAVQEPSASPPGDRRDDVSPMLATVVPDLREDRRIGAWRAPANRYHLVVRALTARGIPLRDGARAYGVLSPGGAPGAAPRPYQVEAIDAWRAAGRRGVVVLPTGTGKTLVAVLAIRDAARATLVVVPTLDLLHQWFDLLASAFGAERVGVIGGGEHRPAELTVTTYDSAYLHLDRLGDRFGLVVWDEAHHVAGPSTLQAARMALAPFVLGLTATPIEADDERRGLIDDALGPIVYRREIGELKGEFLSTYEVVRVKVELGPDERAAHDAARARFKAFVTSRGLRLGGPQGWSRFLEASSRSPDGRAALAAWREQRRIAMATPAKLDVLAGILARHAGERAIVFTHGNDAAYEVSRRFLVPAITHQTKPSERRAILDGLRDGSLPVVATARVLNEGVDVPTVGVGIVLSGSATVREHVQRLGRILRRVEGKHAMLYEVVTDDTSEEAASQRRRDHDAYR